jgi:XTP/dITP diphosphohydrolase
MHTKEEKMAQFGRILDIMDKLRAECPWNKAQTVDTLRPMTVEEVYELSDAIMKKDDADLKKELGDVLLHVVFYSKIAEEQGKYDIADVLDGLCQKMIFRHPHVFGDKKASTAEEVSENWEMMKTKEKGGNKRILSGVPDSMPSVLKAYSMQDKARGVGFDWEEKSQVWDKVKEEEGEFQAELDSMASCKGSADPAVGAPTEDSSPEFKEAYDRAEEELGDFMFATINAARLYGLNPDTALNRACDKFRRRFTYLEEQTIRKGRSLHDMTLAEMDAIWDEGKARGL